MSVFVTPIQALQFYDKYSRWSQELGRRETWEETVARVIGFFQKQTAKRNISKDLINWTELSEAMLNMEAMPSMRIVQMAGPALERCEVGAYNCLGIETEFLTSEGLRRFSSFNDGDTISVPSHTGQLRAAKVRKFGRGTLRRVRIYRGRTVYDVWATDNHRWIKADGTTATTAEMDGQALAMPPFGAGQWSYESAPPDEKLAWAYGYVYGDGTISKKDGVPTYSMVRLCGADKGRFLPRFIELGFSYSEPESFGGEPMVYTGGYLKELPGRTAERRMLIAFVRGLLDADGGKATSNSNKNIFTSLQVTGSDRINAVRDLLHRAGVYVTREDAVAVKTNLGPRSDTTVRFGLFCGAGVASNSYFRIQLTDETREDDLWCLEVDQDQSFVLAGGIVTRNCAFLPIDSWDAFGELLYILMQGTGAGFSVEVDYVDSLPRIKRQKGSIADTYVVPDTTEGWCDALTLGLKAWADGRDINYDFSRIRPQGTVLRTKGGRASGPEPLRQLLAFARGKLLASQGKRLDPIDAHDIACFCGQIVQVGGVRRAALISLSDLDDRDMRDAKAGQFWLNNVQRAMANNSAVYHERPKSTVFLEEWISLAKSGTGERGIFNRGGLSKQLPKRRRKVHDFGVNPCFAPGTLVHTSQGHFPIEELVGKTVDVWNGEAWQGIDNFRVTGEGQEVIRVELHDGSGITVTPYHTFILNDGSRVQAKDLTVGTQLKISEAPIRHGSISELAPYLKGFLLGDGTLAGANPALWLYEPKYGCENRLVASLAELPAEDIKATYIVSNPGFRDDTANNRRIMTGLSVRRTSLAPWVSTYRNGLPHECFAWDLRSKTEFLAGFLDADGGAADTANGWMYQAWSVSKSLLLDIQALLKTIGVASRLSLGKKATAVDFNDGYGEYDAQDCWRLTIGQASSVELAKQVVFSRLPSFAHKRTAYAVRPKFNAVSGIGPAGIAEKVYCCTVDGSHQFALTNGIDIGQCGEIILRPRQFCNLSIAIARENDTEDTLTDKVRKATIFGTIQSLLTDFKYLPAEWKQNCEEERLLGVDITGQMDCPLLRPATDKHESKRRDLLTRLRETAVVTNSQLAMKLGIPQSAAVTCIKPSGNSAQLFNCSSGLHPRFAKYYLRRLRIGAFTPIAKLLKDSGVPYFPEVGQSEQTATVLVFEFPVAAPDGAPTRHDFTAVQQLDNWLALKLYYTEHNPSVTIYVEDHEWPAVSAWVYDNFDHIGGLSFLPKDGGQYELAPYEEITKEEYENRTKALPAIDFSQLSDYEKEDMTEINREFACTGDRCEI